MVLARISLSVGGFQALRLCIQRENDSRLSDAPYSLVICRYRDKTQVSKELEEVWVIFKYPIATRKIFWDGTTSSCHVSLSSVQWLRGPPILRLDSKSFKRVPDRPGKTDCNNSNKKCYFQLLGWGPCWKTCSFCRFSCSEYLLETSFPFFLRVFVAVDPLCSLLHQTTLVLTEGEHEARFQIGTEPLR